MRPPGRSRIGCVKEAKGWVEEKTTRPREKPNRGTSVALLSATGPILRHTRGMGGHVMRTSLAATVGSTLLAVALTAGLAGAQSGTATDTTKDSSAPSTQTDQSSQQPAQPSQPGQPSQSSPAQVAPGSNQSNSTTDVRSESRTTERVVDTERTRILGMDPTLAVLVGAVLLIVVILAIVAMSRRQTTEPGQPTRRAL